MQVEITLTSSTVYWYLCCTKCKWR